MPRKIEYARPPRSAGEALLRNQSAPDVAKKVGVYRQTALQWMHGRIIPEGPNREALEAAFAIPVGDWDRRPGDTVAPPPAPTAEAAPAPDNQTNIEHARAARDCARRWRIRCEAGGSTPTELGRAFESERKALETYARLSGEIVATDAAVLKSPRFQAFFARLRDLVTKHPGVADDLRLAISEVFQ